ncbi:PAS domain-containing protein [Ramlibacter henchirensis]|nr:PAS domain-containing protein [Ramlibacter henchirensis]
MSDLRPGPRAPGADVFADAGRLAAAIAEATDDAIFAKDLESRYRFANGATLAAVNRTAAEVLGRTDAEFMEDPDMAHRLMHNDRRVIATGEVLDAEEAIHQADGSLRYWWSRKLPLRDPSGRIVGVLGIARDITERKRVEARMEADHLKLEMGIKAAGLVMAEIDYLTNENHISAELARLLELGDTEMTVPRQAIFDRIHPDDRERYLQAIAEVLKPTSSGHLAIDVRGLLPSGTVRWLHIRLQIVFAVIDGKLQPMRGICAARDVTAEMVAERKLRTAQRLTESVIEGAGALVYAKDLKGRYILSNEAWRAQHGVDREASIGITDGQLFGAEVAAELRASDAQVLERGEHVVVQEKMVVRGRQVTYRSSKFPLYDEGGRIYAVCGVSTDITDVVEADRRKDAFIATLAHELRNPLAPIRNGLEIMRRLEDLPPVARRTRDMMERQLVHLVRLVDDLLDVSRITRDRLDLRLERVTLDQVVAHALESSQPGVEAAGHTLEVHMPAGPVPLRGDLTRLAQVISNLVNNAAKYTPRGGHIVLGGEVLAGQLLLHVKDNGKGIAADMLPQVFDLFVQGEDTRESAQGGLGIGLWLVRKLVELHDGEVGAHSDGPGRGSIFTVRLPLLRE